MTETATSINQWADQTFGMIPFGMEGRAIDRALEELAEVEETIDFCDDDTNDELADVWVVLLRVCGHFRYEPSTRPSDEMQRRIDRKMKKNRLRTWEPDGTGHGQHVREAE